MVHPVTDNTRIDWCLKFVYKNMTDKGLVTLTPSLVAKSQPLYAQNDRKFL